MKLKSALKATVIAAMLTGMATSSFAKNDAPVAYETQASMLSTADEALSAITQIQTARIALFENKIGEAKAAAEMARSSLIKAETDLTAKLVRDFSTTQSTTNYLPFDMSMSLTEAFQATEENTRALQRAAGLFESAAPDDAVAVLKLAEIDVQVTAALLPYEQTLTALDGAIGNIEDGAYFDANLDLKSVADSVITRAFSIDAIPSQGPME